MYHVLELVLLAGLRYRGRVFSAETGGAETVFFFSGQTHHAVPAEKGQGIRADESGDFFRAASAGDETGAAVDIRPVIAGRYEGRRGHPHMDGSGAGPPQLSYDAAAGGAPDQRIVDQDHTFARHRGTDGVELDADSLFPLGLPRCDEGAADILDRKSVV